MRFSSHLRIFPTRAYRGEKERQGDRDKNKQRDADRVRDKDDIV